MNPAIEWSASFLPGWRGLRRWAMHIARPSRALVPLLFLLFQCPPDRANCQQPTVEEILLKMEEQYRRAERSSGTFQYQGVSVRSDGTEELNTQGRVFRINYDSYIFRDRLSQRSPKHDPAILKASFDGSMFKTLQSFPGRQDQITGSDLLAGSYLSSGHERIFRAMRAQADEAYWFNFHMPTDRAPVFELLREEIDEVRLSEESRDGKVVFRLTAELREGDYEIVVDPSRSYNLTYARITKHRDRGHFDIEPEYWGETTPAYDTEMNEFEFQEIDGHWYIVAATHRVLGLKDSTGPYTSVFRMQVEDFQLLSVPPEPGTFDITWPVGTQVTDRNFPDFVRVVGPGGVLSPSNLGSIHELLESNLEDQFRDRETVSATSASSPLGAVTQAGPEGVPAPAAQSTLRSLRVWGGISFIVTGVAVLLGIGAIRRKGRREAR